MKLDREYFKTKKSGKKPKGRYTKCCNQENDRDILNKNNKADWALIENHCEDHLIRYSNTETIEPICCKKCGRLMEYKSTISDKAYK
jgi:hypothetical protein